MVSAALSFKAVRAAVENQVLTGDQVRQVLDPHRAGDQERDEEAVAVEDGHVLRPIRPFPAGVHQPQAQLEQVGGADQPPQLVTRRRRRLLELVVETGQRRPILLGLDHRQHAHRGAEDHRRADRGDAGLQLGHELAEAIVGCALPGSARRGERLRSTDSQSEYGFVDSLLLEGEEPSSNPLRAFFNDLRTTQNLVDVAWRITR